MRLPMTRCDAVDENRGSPDRIECQDDRKAEVVADVGHVVEGSVAVQEDRVQGGTPGR